MSYKKLWKSQLLISKKGKFLRDMDKEFQCEPYLLLHDYNFRQQRVFTAKLRTSDHTLAVEYGRRTTPKIKFEDRVCKLCSAQAVEDEMHFISECTLYSKIRIDFFEKCYDFFPNIRLLNMRDKFRFLLYPRTRCDERNHLIFIQPVQNVGREPDCCTPFVNLVTFYSI